MTVLGRARLELATNALKGRCSTIELPTRDEESFVLYLEHDRKVGAQRLERPRSIGITSFAIYLIKKREEAFFRLICLTDFSPPSSA